LLEQRWDSRYVQPGASVLRASTVGKLARAAQQGWLADGSSGGGAVALCALLWN